MARETYKERLAELQGELLEMGKLVDQAIALSIQALANRDAALARRIIDGDVEEKCLVLIATQQPLASDLRTILSVSNIATEMERMGDYAKGIAQITLDMADQPLLKPLIDVPRMANKGRQLLRDQLDAFIRRDVDAARRLPSAGRPVCCGWLTTWSASATAPPTSVNARSSWLQGRSRN